VPLLLLLPVLLRDLLLLLLLLPTLWRHLLPLLLLLLLLLPFAGPYLI
jgi:hypothetical protein